MNDSIDMALQQSAAAAAAAAAYSETATPRRGFNDCPGSVAEDTPASVQIINGGTGTVASDAGAASDAGGAGSDTASGGGLTAAAAAAAGPGITCMTFDRVQQYNAYTSMIETHSKFHHATHGRHERMRMGPWRTRKKGHQAVARPPLFTGDPGPWDGTAHTRSILDQKLHVAADQADMQDKYVPLSQFKHRDEVPQKWVDQGQEFSALFHVDNCLTLQLKAAKNMAGLLSDNDPPEDPHMVALMEKRKCLGRHIWMKALPSTGSKWANQVARMQTAVNQEDFNADGRLEGGPCEYNHRSLKKGGKPFRTNFHLPSSGTGGQNINGTKTKLLVVTESEFTEAAKAKLWARAKLVDEAARVHEIKKQMDRLRAPPGGGKGMQFDDDERQAQRGTRGFSRQSLSVDQSRGRMTRGSAYSQRSLMGTRRSSLGTKGTQRGGIRGTTREGTRAGAGRGYAAGRGESRLGNDDRRGNTAGGYSIRLSSSRPESRSTVISRPVSRMATTTSRPGSRVVSSAKQDMKMLAMRDF
jgi:hypothetical protein